MNRKETLSSHNTSRRAAHLHDGVGGEHLLLDLRLRLRPADRREVAHRVLGRHRLSGAGLARHDDGLVLVEAATREENSA